VNRIQHQLNELRRSIQASTVNDMHKGVALQKIDELDSWMTWTEIKAKSGRMPGLLIQNDPLDIPTTPNIAVTPKTPLIQDTFRFAGVLRHEVVLTDAAFIEATSDPDILVIDHDTHYSYSMPTIQGGKFVVRTPFLEEMPSDNSAALIIAMRSRENILRALSHRATNA
jgi:hypothetical protein